MKILLTGGTGFIASHCAVVLLQKGYKVILVDNLINSNNQVVDGIKDIVGESLSKNLTFIQCDVTDKTKLSIIFTSVSIDCVIHFAAHKAVGESVKDPLKYYRNNLLGLITVLECMSETGVTNIIFSSSATVYKIDNSYAINQVNEAKNNKLNESDITGPINPYGQTKLMAEQIIKDWCNASSTNNITNINNEKKQQSQTCIKKKSACIATCGDSSKLYNKQNKAVILRYFNPVGAHPSGKIGEDPKGPANNLFPVIYRVLQGELEELSVFGGDYNTHDGTGVRDYIHVMDLAKGHCAALDYIISSESNFYEVLNLGSGVGYSVLDIIKAFEKEEHKISYKIKNRRPGDAASVVCDTQKAKRLLNWQTEKILDDMVKDSLNFINN